VRARILFARLHDIGRSESRPPRRKLFWIKLRQPFKLASCSGNFLGPTPCFVSWLGRSYFRCSRNHLVGDFVGARVGPTHSHHARTRRTLSSSVRSYSFAPGSCKRSLTNTRARQLTYQPTTIPSNTTSATLDESFGGVVVSIIEEMLRLQRWLPSPPRSVQERVTRCRFDRHDAGRANRRGGTGHHPTH